MRICPLFLCGLAVMACSRSGSDGPRVLAAATIGPEGGVIAIDGGVQAGLRLTVPAGALMAPVAFRIRDMTPVMVPGTGIPAVVDPPGQPFLVEPSNLGFALPATLRAPYRTSRVMHTGPGNVRARNVRNGNTIDYDPAVVDVSNGHIELPIYYLGQFQVVQGLPAELSTYWQQPGATIALADGFEFAVEEVPAPSPFASPTAQRWRIDGPSGTDLLYFDDQQLRGRESPTADWRETWNEWYPVWRHISLVPTIGALTTTTQVYVPMTGLPLGGQMTVYAVWSWVEPRRVADRLLLDVVQLRVTLAWNRADLGIGQREYLFWFSPGIGLIGFAQDGLAHARLML